MNSACIDKIKKVIKKDSPSTIKEIYAIFTCTDIVSLIDSLKSEINDNFDVLLYDEEFTSIYHLFFYHILEKMDHNIEDLSLYKHYIETTLRQVKGYLKDYTKNKKHKDGFYHLVHSLVIDKLKSAIRYINSLLAETDEVEHFKIIWFIITDLKNPDYLFRIIELHPEYVNIKNKHGVPLFKHLIEYIYANLRFWDNEKIKYYKRVFVLLLESDELSISNEDLFEILELTEKNLLSSLPATRKHLKFFLMEINSHYELINKDSRVNAHSYVSRECPVDIIIPSSDDRIDMRDLFTISIDSTRKSEIRDKAIDDAYSIKPLEDGAFEVYIHIPDVGTVVPIDSETDRFMRALGESVYAHDQKTPLLHQDIATQVSLTKGLERPAITFIIRVSATGEVQDISFRKTLINVNYNLTRKQAEIFMDNNNDERLYMINYLYEVATLLRKRRKEKVGTRRPSEIIMDEMNIWPDILTAEYCAEAGIPFPYKNYFGLRSVRNVEHVSASEQFSKKQGLSPEAKNILYSIFDINNRVFYDMQFVRNKSSKNRPIGNVGNPLREYISLETDRMIKDLIIDHMKNTSYWSERLERDCIEYTETSAKIKQLYHRR